MKYQAVLINRLGELFEITYNNLSNLKTKFELKGLGKPEVLHTFTDFNITLIGYKNGDEKIINKSELPPPIDSDLFYGDIIAYSTKQNLTCEDYQEFWDNIFQVEDLDDTLLDDELEMDEDDDYDYDDGFVVRDDECDEEELIIDDESSE